MAGRNGLFVPGPTNVPERVLRAMVVPMEDHRSPKFPQLTLHCLAGLKKVFKTETGTPFIFPSSGTGCWEAALTNCLSPGDMVLIARFGQFSHLWVDMCHRLGFETQVLECEWGEGAPVDRYRAALALSLAVILGLVGAAALSGATPRFRYPYDPLIWTLASMGLCGLLESLRAAFARLRARFDRSTPGELTPA